MSEDVQIILIANIFRIMSLLIGFGFACLGYKLYVKGVFDKTQDLKASFGNAKLALRNVAPGVVFGIAGIVVAILAVVRPVMLDHSRESQRHGSASATPRIVDSNSRSAESSELSHLKDPKTQSEDEVIKDELFASHDMPPRPRSCKDVFRFLAKLNSNAKRKAPEDLWVGAQCKAEDASIVTFEWRSSGITYLRSCQPSLPNALSERAFVP
jgi:hypothetical protein